MAKPLLHLVFGGRVADPQGVDFVDPDQLHLVGIYPNYQKALQAWRGASQAKVDQADYKYVIVHLHRLLDPETGIQYGDRRRDDSKGAKEVQKGSTK